MCGMLVGPISILHIFGLCASLVWCLSARQTSHMRVERVCGVCRRDKHHRTITLTEPLPRRDSREREIMQGTMISCVFTLVAELLLGVVSVSLVTVCVMFVGPTNITHTRLIGHCGLPFPPHTPPLFSVEPGRPASGGRHPQP